MSLGEATTAWRALRDKRVDGNDPVAERKEIVAAIVAVKVQEFADTWARLHHELKVNSYRELPATQHLNARNYLIGKLPKAEAENVAHDAPKPQPITLNETIAMLIRQVESGNSAPVMLFMPW